MKKVNTKLMMIIFIAIVLFTTTVSASFAQQLGVFDIIKPFNSYASVYSSDVVESMRPLMMGTHGAISTGHYLATNAGIEIFRKGGNAFDAGVGAAMALKVTQMDMAGWCGLAPLILYSARENIVTTRTGCGTSPALLTLEQLLKSRKAGFDLGAYLPPVPADVDVWLTTLDRFGTMSFEEVAQYALEIAEEGYHMFKPQYTRSLATAEGIKKWPYNMEFWFQNSIDRKQKIGDIMVNKDLGKLIRYMIDAERRILAAGGNRSDGIWAARNAFYKGEPAKAVDKFYRELPGGLIRYEDFASYQGEWQKPLHTTYKGYDIYAPRGWCQGPRIILWLNMLENFDLHSLGYNTPEYIHLISQVIDLGMSDCHKYIGDPDFADIPMQLYSKEYARERIKLIDMEQAFDDMPPWGDPRKMKNIADDSPKSFISMKDSSQYITMDNQMTTVDSGTTSLNVIDGEGNTFSMTESDGHMHTPMIPGWGFGIARRCIQFNSDQAFGNVAAPNKRNRNTNAPFLVMKDGKPFMGLSTPGGDKQLQALMQVFFNVVEWGMDVQQAVDQPRFFSFNFIGTGTDWVNKYPAQLNIESRIPQETFEALKKKGHFVVDYGLWTLDACAPTITYRDPETGIIYTAGDVRRETSSMAY